MNEMRSPKAIENKLNLNSKCLNTKRYLLQNDQNEDTILLHSHGNVCCVLNIFTMNPSNTKLVLLFSFQPSTGRVSAPWTNWLPAQQRRPWRERRKKQIQSQHSHHCRWDRQRNLRKNSQNQSKLNNINYSWAILSPFLMLFSFSYLGLTDMCRSSQFMIILFNFDWIATLYKWYKRHSCRNGLSLYWIIFVANWLLDENNFLVTVSLPQGNVVVLVIGDF